MKEILSTKISLEDTLTLKDMLSLHHFSKTYSGTIFFLAGHKFVNPNNLPKFVSFLLTYKKHELKIIVEGPKVQYTLAKIESMLNHREINKKGLIPIM